MQAGRARPDRPRGREPLSVPRDRRARRAVRRDHREHRHRRAGDDPLGGEEPRARRGGRRPRRLRARCSPRSTTAGEVSAPRCVSSWRARRSRTPPPTTAPSRRTWGGSERPTRAPADFPETLHVGGALARALRYGENPHQKAAFYALDGAPGGPSLARAEVLQGKELSYNNLLDLDAALRLVRRVRGAGGGDHQAQQPVRRGDLRRGRGRRLPARARDRSGVGVRRHRRREPPRRRRAGPRADRDLPRVRDRAGFAPEALPILAAKKNLRLLVCDIAPERRGRRSSCAASRAASWCRRAIATPPRRPPRKVVTKRAPTADELRDLDFAWRVCKHVKSNAIVFAAAGARWASAPGQMSRVDSVRIAVSQGAGAAGRVGASRRTRSSRSATASTRRPRRARRPSSSRAARCATPSRSPPPTSTASRWSSPASATSGTSRHAGLPRRLGAGASTRSPGSSGRARCARRSIAAPGQPRASRARRRSRCIPVAADAIAELVAAAVARARRSGRVRARGAARGRAGRRDARRPGCRSSARRAPPPRSRARRRSRSG